MNICNTIRCLFGCCRARPQREQAPLQPPIPLFADGIRAAALNVPQEGIGLDQRQILPAPAEEMIERVAERAIVLPREQNIPPRNEAPSVENLAFRLINDQTDGISRGQIIDAIRQIPAAEREAAVAQALRLIKDQTDGNSRRKIIDAIRQIPAAEREAAVAQALRLINDQTDGYYRQYIINWISQIPAAEREGEVAQALRLINDQTDGDSRGTIIYWISLIPAAEREGAVAQALRLINDQTDGNSRGAIIYQIRRIPAAEREGAVNRAFESVQLPNDAGSRRAVINHFLDAVQRNRVQPAVREPILNEIIMEEDAESDDEGGEEENPIPNFQADMPGRNEFEVGVNNPVADFGPFEISQEDIANQPRSALLNYALRLENGIPRVEYLGSEGNDLGGVTRDFITRLFQALFPKKSDRGGSHLQAEYDNLELPIPQTPSVDGLCHFRAVGSILGEILAGRLKATTGVRFSPVFFEMLHALTEEEIRRSNEPEFQTSAYLKILRIYCKSRYTWLTEQEIGEIVQGRLPQRMETDQDHTYAEFILESGIGGIFSAVLSIASEIASAVSWDRDKKETPVQLGEAIQGQFSKQAVIEALNGNRDTPQKQFLARWINESDEAEVRRFLLCVSGSETVGALPLNIHPYQSNVPRRRPSFHTCSQQIDLPQYADYALFKELLEESLASAADFQTI